MRFLDTIIVHCAATKPSMDIGVDEIRKWHTDPKPRGRGWKDIGYHWVIRRNGFIEQGRPINVSGAHARGHNLSSIGICLVGGIDEAGNPSVNYTTEQYDALRYLIDKQISMILRQDPPPEVSVIGHSDVDPKKPDCPGFSVAYWYYEGLRTFSGARCTTTIP